jgi:DNA (cytosine-5)-methyltransferase 1
MSAYYNEHDPYAAQWLRNLIAAGLIAPGDVDERDIRDVRPNDLRGYTQCHFFSGIGVWSYALRRAGWPDDRPVWTGSCPCQPFSSAGKRKGTADERHLWPAWFHLIEQCRPDTIFGEQVETAIRHGWLDLVQADLEGISYAVGKTVLPAAGFGAPHIRHRLFFVADADQQQRHWSWQQRQGGWTEPPNSSTPVGVADAKGERHEGESIRADGDAPNGTEKDSLACRMANTNDERCDREHALLWQDEPGRNKGETAEAARCGEAVRPGPVNGFWRDADWIGCRDGKWRAVEPCTFPMAHGVAAGVGRLRAYGNAIVAPVAEAFVRAFMELQSTP